MRNKLLMTAFALMAAAPAYADPWDFVLINDAGKTIKTVEVSPAGANSWVANTADPDMKHADSIKVAGRTTIHFEKNGSQCKFDIKATFEDGSSAVWSGVNVCDNSFVTLRYKDGAPTFAAN